MQIRTLLMVVLLSAIVMLSGCTTPTPQSIKRTIDPDNWQVIREVIGEPQTVDPASAYDTASGEVLENVYETLYTYEYGNPKVLVPKLATALPTWNVAGTQCTINLRQNITFTDGAKFNATAVKESLDRVVIINDAGGPGWMFAFLKGAAAYQALNMSTVTQQNASIYRYGPDGVKGTADDDQAGVYISGEYQVILTLAEPYVAFTAILAYSIADIISPKLIKDHPDTPGDLNDYISEHMVGTGPYKLKEWKQTVSVALELNKAYWDLPTTHTPPTAVLLKLVPEAATRLSHLKAGEADIIDYASGLAANIWDFTAKKSLFPDVVNVTIGHSTWSVVNFAMNQRFAIYNNTDFRKSLCYAFPYEQYINETIKGFGVRMRSVIPKDMYGWSNTWQYEYNPSLASTLMNHSGILDGHVAGVNPVNMTIVYNQGNTNRKAACLLLEQSVEEISNGTVAVTVKEMAWAQYLDALDAQALGMWLIGWGPDYADPDDYIVPYYDGRYGYYCLRTGWNNATCNTLIDNAKAETNPTTRAGLYQQIESIAYNEAVYIHLYEATGFNVKGTWVRGWKNNPMNSGYLYIELSVDIAAYKF